MKYLIATLMLVAVALPAYSQQDRTDLQGYTLVFEDEFNTLSVGDHNNKGDATWGDAPPYGAPSNFSFSHWGTLRFGDQYWTVNNGILSLHMKYYADMADSGRPWVSGVLASRDRENKGFAQRFGYWSARLKLPNAGQGAWPAFWLASSAGIPSAGGDGYEIDIMEFYGGILNPGNPPTYPPQHGGPWYDFLVHAWQDRGGQDNEFSSTGSGRIPVSDPVSEWHIYGCEVNPTHIIGYLDGVEVARIPTGAKYIDDPLYIILNYAMQNHHDGEPFASVEAARVDAATSPFQVDWVRAWSLPSSVVIPPVDPVSFHNRGYEDNEDGDQVVLSWGEGSANNANYAGWVTSGGRTGNVCYRMNLAASQLELSQTVRVRGEQPLWELSVWARASHGGFARIEADGLETDYFAPIPASDEWVQVKIQNINLVGESRLRAELYADNTTSTPMWVEVDDWVLKPMGDSDPAPQPAPAPTPAPVVTIPATSGALTPPFVVENDYVHQPIDTVDGDPTVNGSGRAVYNFNIPQTGSYIIYGLVNTPGPGDNSFWINIDAEPTNSSTIWDIVPHTADLQAFKNRNVHWRGGGSEDSPQFRNKVWELSAGPHQLIIRGREPAQIKEINIRPVVGPGGGPTPTPTPTPVPTPTPTPTPAPTWQESKITDLRVESGTGTSVTLTWTKPAQAVDHIIRFDDDPQLDGLRRDNAPPALMTGLRAGVTYFFEIQAVNAQGQKNKASDRISYTPGTPVPTPTPTPPPTPTPTPTPVPTPVSARAVSVKTKHMPGTQITISAPATVNGKAFAGWQGDRTTLANPNSPQTTMTVPTSLDPSVEATYQP